MSHFYKSLMSLTFIIGLIAPQTLLADFYVIPVGKQSSYIKAADVKSFSAFISPNTAEVLYTVPAGKAFVVTNISVGAEEDTELYAQFNIGPNYKEKITYTGSSTYFSKNYNLGIVINEGDNITAICTSASHNILFSINGYLTNP